MAWRIGLGAVVLAGLGLGLGACQPEPVSGRPFRLHASLGDTVWGLANCLGQPVDTRVVVEILLQANPAAERLTPGDDLWVPAEIAGGHLCASGVIVAGGPPIN